MLRRVRVRSVVHLVDASRQIRWIRSFRGGSTQSQDLCIFYNRGSTSDKQALHKSHDRREQVKSLARSGRTRRDSRGQSIQNYPAYIYIEIVCRSTDWRPDQAVRQALATPHSFAAETPAIPTSPAKLGKCSNSYVWLESDKWVLID